MRSTWLCLEWLCLACLMPLGLGVAAEPESDPRLDYLLEQADRLKIELPSELGPPRFARLEPAPLLRYTNPLYEAQSDGALFLWTDQQVPVALGSYSIRNEKHLFRELVSASEAKLVCRRGSQTVWSPLTSGFARRDFPKAPPPPKNPRLRLTYMKRLADRITVANHRRLATPLYRYAATDAGIVDGAVLALVKANDPELLILIEAYQGGGPARWRYSLARMNSQPFSVQLDGETVWDLPGYWRHPRKPTDPYVEQKDSDLPGNLTQKALAEAKAGETDQP